MLMDFLRYTLISFFLIYGLCACKKVASNGSSRYQLAYADSVFYISDQPTDITVAPLDPKQGSYFSFPDGLELDSHTGLINVSKSEAGLRYRIDFKGVNGDLSSTYLVISGINFPDHYYRLENADSVAFPVYNADPAKPLPNAQFDEDKVVSGSGCSIKTDNGQINLSQSIKNGLFGKNPQTNTRKDFELKYRLGDKSGKALNKIKVLIYYYEHPADVPADLTQTVQEHQAMTIKPDNTTVVTGAVSLAAKPRPPCIVIIAHNN